MSVRGRLAAVMVVLFELVGGRAARADASAGASAKDGGHARRTKALPLDLSLAWPQPPAPPLIPPAGGAAIPSAPAPAAPTVQHANGAQVAMAMVITLIGDAAGLLVLGGTGSIWAGAIPMTVAPFGAGAVVCNIGAAMPGRGGRCRATLAGALIGAAAGLLPGMLIVASAGSKPNEEDAYHAWLQNELTGFEVTFLLYAVAVPVGTVIGYNVGDAAQPNPVTMPPVASVPLFTLRF